MRWMILAAVLALAGCDELLDEDDADATIVDRCDIDGGTLEVAGQWSVEGEGRIEDCSDGPFRDGRIELAADLLRVAQNDDGLRLVDAPPDFALIDGQVHGRCVSFRTRERLRDDNEMLLTFEGEVGALGDVSGSFTGEGPSTCRSRGEFTIEIR